MTTPTHADKPPSHASPDCCLLYTSVDALQKNHPQVSPGSIAASLLSLVLITPLVQSDRRVARSGGAWLAVTSLSGLIFLNLCLLLPVLAIAPYLKAATNVVHFAPFVIDLREFAPHTMLYPLGVWRLDAMLLLIISALFAPVGLGKWNLGRLEGLGLIIAYFIYLFVVTVAAT